MCQRRVNKVLGKEWYMGFTYCKKSMGNYSSCLEGFCTCIWGPRSELLLAWPLNKWGAEILLDIILGETKPSG